METTLLLKIIGITYVIGGIIAYAIFEEYQEIEEPIPSVIKVVGWPIFVAIYAIGGALFGIVWLIWFIFSLPWRVFTLIIYGLVSFWEYLKYHDKFEKYFPEE